MRRVRAPVRPPLLRLRVQDERQLERFPERRARGEEPESFDKEYVRRWLAAQGWTGDGPMPPIPDEVRVEASRRYVEACETIMGRPFVADLEDPQVRIRRNLGLAP